jgi:hypothetical protein
MLREKLIEIFEKNNLDGLSKELADKVLETLKSHEYMLDTKVVISNEAGVVDVVKKPVGIELIVWNVDYTQADGLDIYDSDTTINKTKNLNTLQKLETDKLLNKREF